MSKHTEKALETDRMEEQDRTEVPVQEDANEATPITPPSVDGETAADQAVEEGKRLGLDVPEKEVRRDEPNNTPQENLDADITPKAHDLNQDKNPNVTSPVEQAHRYAELSMSGAALTDVPNGEFVLPDRQFMREAGNFNVTDTVFPQRLASAVVNAVAKMQGEAQEAQEKGEKVGAQSEKIVLTPVDTVGLPFSLVLTVKKYEK